MQSDSGGLGWGFSNKLPGDDATSGSDFEPWHQAHGD